MGFMSAARLEIQSWLKQKRAGSLFGSLLGSLAVALLAAAVLFVTFWVIYAVVWLGFNWFLPHSHATRLIISGVILVLLFIGNARTDRAYLEELSFTTGTAGNRVVSFYVPGVGIGSNINPLAPDSMHSYVKIMTLALFAGPRLATVALRLASRAFRSFRIDSETLVPVIASLAEHDDRIAFKEVAKELPPGSDIETVMTQLRDLDIVLFLKSEPLGLKLTSEAREELLQRLGRTKRSSAAGGRRKRRTSQLPEA